MDAILEKSALIYAELHILCIFILIRLYFAMRGRHSREERRIDFHITAVYFASVYYMFFCAAWDLMETFHVDMPVLAYIVNIGYFISEIMAIFAWLQYCLQMTQSRFLERFWFRAAIRIPIVILCVLNLTAPFNGWMFYIKDAAYFRGPLFFISVVIKLICIVSSATIVIIANRQSDKVLRIRPYLLLLFTLPVFIAGILQAAIGYDFICVGLTAGLVLLYENGVSNTNKANSDLIYSIARSYDASFIVDMRTHTIRTLRVGTDYNESVARSTKTDIYDEYIRDAIDRNVIPEDRDYVISAFDLKYVRKRLAEDNTFSIVYRLTSKNGELIHHRATFMLATDYSGRDKFMFGLQNVNIDKILAERASELSEQRDRLERINEDIIAMAANIVEARDTESGEHILRVKEYTRILAARMMGDYPEYGLTPERMRSITSASALHDIGKVMIPDAILLKPGRLTKEEFEIMKTHCEKGAKILEKYPLGMDNDYLAYARDICLYHHERYDGNGYPKGLIGEEIPVAAQIVSVVDCFDALTTKRVYKDAIEPEKAIEMILNGECGHFSPKLIRCFLNVREDFIRQCRGTDGGEA